MTSCWLLNEKDRPTFEEIRTNLSRVIDKDNYLSMNNDEHHSIVNEHENSFCDYLLFPTFAKLLLGLHGKILFKNCCANYLHSCLINKDTYCVILTLCSNCYSQYLCFKHEQTSLFCARVIHENRKNQF